MNIAIIGTGNMGSTEAGHQVWLGSREARKRGRSWPPKSVMASKGDTISRRSMPVG